MRIALGVFIFVVVTIALMIHGKLAAQCHSLPPIVRGVVSKGPIHVDTCALEATAADSIYTSNDLDVRLRHQFPPGTSVANLKSTLEAQGFSLHHEMYTHTEFLDFQQQNLIGEISASVYWKSNAHHQILSTSGFTGEIAF